MQIKIFTTALAPDEQQMDEINHFLRAHKIIDVRKEVAVQNGNSVWTFCISYLLDSTVGSAISNKNAKIDYKEVLDESAFTVFSRLRKIRKAIADEEAVPAYTTMRGTAVRRTVTTTLPTTATTTSGFVWFSPSLGQL